MYKTAAFMVKHFWSKPTEVAEGPGVLLFTCNKDFHRLCPFGYDHFKKCIAKNETLLEQLLALQPLQALSRRQPDKVALILLLKGSNLVR
jgi:hypothetical protein